MIPHEEMAKPRHVAANTMLIAFIVNHMNVIPTPKTTVILKESVEPVAYLNGGSGIPWYK